MKTVSMQDLVDIIAEKNKTIEAQEKQIADMKKVMTRVRDDLLMRADPNGWVAVGSSVWVVLQESLGVNMGTPFSEEKEK